MFLIMLSLLVVSLLIVGCSSEANIEDELEEDELNAEDLEVDIESELSGDEALAGEATYGNRRSFAVTVPDNVIPGKRASFKVTSPRFKTYKYAYVKDMAGKTKARLNVCNAKDRKGRKCNAGTHRLSTKLSKGSKWKAGSYTFKVGYYYKWKGRNRFKWRSYPFVIGSSSGSSGSDEFCADHFSKIEPGDMPMCDPAGSPDISDSYGCRADPAFPPASTACPSGMVLSNTYGYASGNTPSYRCMIEQEYLTSTPPPGCPLTTSDIQCADGFVYDASGSELAWNGPNAYFGCTFKCKAQPDPYDSNPNWPCTKSGYEPIGGGGGDNCCAIE